MNKKVNLPLMFTISLLPTGDIDPFDLGHFSFTIADKTYTSDDTTNKKAFMVFPTLIDLFEGMLKLSKLKIGSWRLDTVGSSYDVSFKKEKKGIFISLDNENIGLFDEKELAKAIWQGYDDFFQKHDLVPEKLGPLVMDFIDSVEAFEASYELN